MEKKFFSINGDISTQVYEKFLKFVDEVIRSDTKEIVIIIDSMVVKSHMDLPYMIYLWHWILK